jgi:hypothetical protein
MTADGLAREKEEERPTTVEGGSQASGNGVFSPARR